MLSSTVSLVVTDDSGAALLPMLAGKGREHQSSAS